MKKILISLVIISSMLTACNSYSQSGWIWHNPLPFGVDMEYIKFFNENTGFTILESKVYKTTNSGINWIIPGDTVGAFHDVQFLDVNTGIITGSLIHKTTNGGLNWIDISYYTPVSIQFQAVSFIDILTGFVACWAFNPYTTTAGFIIKTTNSGVNWVQTNLTQPHIFFDIDIKNSGFGVALAVDSNYFKLYKTFNFGNSWSILLTYIYAGYHSNRLYLADSLIYFITSNGLVHRTSNGGINWQNINVLNNIENITFSTNNIGYAVGKEGLVYITTDKGINWIQQMSSSNYNFYSVDFINQNIGFISGMKGGFFRTTNGGLNWTTDSRSFTFQNLYDILFFNSDTILITADSGQVFKTYNQGLNWISIYSGVPLQLTKMQFIDDNTGYALIRDTGSAMKTTNGGLNWKRQFINNDMYSLDLCFLNKDTGFFSGSIQGWTSKFYKTTNGGENWNECSFGNNYITSIEFLNNHTGFLGMSGSRIYKTTNGGNNWNEKYNTGGSNISDIGFFNDNVYIACNKAGYVLRSTDIGESWSIITRLVLSGLNRICITDSTKSYITAGSQIFYSSDMGLNWVSQKFPYTSSGVAVDVDFFGNTGMIVGPDGSILKTTTGGNVFIQNVSGIIPEVFTLYQNYPNPFNPITNIKFDLPKNGFVTLKLFDILGREITTLVEGNLKPGTHVANWDGRGFPSGVYFYKLISGDYSMTKKMLLIK